MGLLVGRQLVKRYANIPLADTRWDEILDNLRLDVTRQIEYLTGRQFSTTSRVEFHQSFTQTFGDPQPQWVIPHAAPVTSVTELVWAPYDDHDANGTELLLNEDFRLDTAEDGLVWALRVQRFSTFPVRFPLPAGAGGVIGESPTGFRVTYTGGYAVSASSSSDPFEIGEENVVQIPVGSADEGLDRVAATKIATDFNAHRNRIQPPKGDSAKISATGAALGGSGGMLQPWTNPEKAALGPYLRRSMSWLRQGQVIDQFTGGRIRVVGGGGGPG